MAKVEILVNKSSRVWKILFEATPSKGIGGTIRSSIGRTSQMWNVLSHGLPVPTQVSPTSDKL